jgi:hypothetical protein
MRALFDGLIGSAEDLAEQAAKGTSSSDKHG